MILFPSVVIISDYELIQEAYNTPALCGKHLSEVDAIITQKRNLGKSYWKTFERKLQNVEYFLIGWPLPWM